ncbi:DUF6332 family protein [Streptomyces avicenniae]|uniref:DUF6332 family protein n=1 Tax=Streptomyces avicenniae TaxID=500153 RepID=UPI00069C482B|nr:DUF6332 family protein [Streptomyces avicenniae]
MTVREQGERDELTVEIMFAFVTASVLAAVVACALAAPAWLLALDGGPERAVHLTALACAGAAWIWRAASVLHRHARPSPGSATSRGADAA